jgi:hypothetical protein
MDREAVENIADDARRLGRRRIGVVPRLRRRHGRLEQALHDGSWWWWWWNVPCCVEWLPH